MAKPDWTLDTLHYHLAMRLDEMDKRHTEQFRAHETRAATALDAAARASDRAEAAMSRRFESVNEFRAQLSDQARTFMPRIESERADRAIQLQLADLAARVDKLEGRSLGANTALAYGVGTVGVIASAVTIAIAFLR